MKILRYLTILLGVLFYSLAALPAQEEMVIIDADLCDYDGKSITLTGNVIVEHELGTIHANHVILTPLKNGKRMTFERLELLDDVILELTDGGVLHCAKADLDYKQLTGICRGATSEDYIIFTDTFEDKTGKKQPLTLKCCELSLEITRKDDSPRSNKSYVNRIVGDGDVLLNYCQDFIAVGEQISYQRKGDQENVKSDSLASVPGMITLSTPDGGRRCQVTQRNGDTIDSHLIEIDTAAHTLTFASPEGSVALPSDATNKTTLEFSAETLVWNDLEGTLTLLNNIKIQDEILGMIDNSKKVVFTQGQKDGRKYIQSIDMTGTTLITYNETEKGCSHVLRTTGPVKIDRVTLKATLEKPADGEYVHFEDPMGEVLADTAIIEYSLINNKTVPSKITLAGNVKMHNSVHNELAERGKDILQYVIADAVVYNIPTRDMNLKSNDSKRVLFFDKLNHIQMSAPMLNIKRSSLSSKDSIQGVGDVRFRFLDSEVEQIKKRFNFDIDKGGL